MTDGTAETGTVDTRTTGTGAGRLRPLLDAVHSTTAEVRARRPDYFTDRPLRLSAELLACYGADPGELARLLGGTYALSVEPVEDAAQCTSVDRLAADRARPAAGGSGILDDSGERPPRADEFAAVAREQHARLRAARGDAERIGTAAPLRVGVMGGVLPYLAAGPRREAEPPVVLVNALGMGTALWHPLMAALAPTHRVLVWAPRGTAARTGPMRLRDQADDLAAVLAAEGAADCHLVGWCSGPKTAMEFQRRRPGSVRSMVFLHGSFRYTGDPAGKEPDTPYERNLEELCRTVTARPALAATLRTMFTGRPADIADDLGASRYADEVLALPAPELSGELLRPFTDDAVLVAYAAQLLDFWSYDVLAHAAEVSVPVLCVSAEFDRIASPDRLALAADRFPHGRHERLTGATHYSMYDRPREVAGLLTDFFTAAGRGRAQL